METIIRKLSSNNPGNTLTIKFIAFISWIGYIIIASAYNVLIEAYLFSIGIGVIGYFIFNRKQPLSSKQSSNNKDSHQSGASSSEHNYLSVFFIGSAKIAR